MIRLEGVHAGYGKTDILKGVSAAATTGQFIALIGPNGSGKSTLIKTACGLIAPSRGNIFIQDMDMGTASVRDRAKRISYLSQSREAAPGMLVSDVVALGRIPYRGRLGRLSEKGEQAIEKARECARITEFWGRKYENLSGGEQARVQLARALAVEAPALFLDEPLAALDPYYQLIMMDILKDVVADGHTVVAALHDLGLAHHFADRIWVMQSGRLVADGSPDAVMAANIYGPVFGIVPPESGFPVMTLQSKKQRL